jgi:ribosomal protein S18 acetylase RimI-like enzyme
MSHLCADGVHLAQSQLSPSDQAGAQRLVQHGFVAIAEIHHLASPSAAFPHRAPSGPLTFAAVADEQRDRLAELVARTYRRTLDCPQLNGLRDVRDVLEGYQQTAEFDPQHWLFARRNNRDVGCLLLADHPARGQMELVYMGLVPAVRGRGWGTIIVRHAQWLAWQKRRQQLEVTVDGNNTPAIDIYRAAGFIPWDRRLVLIKDLRASRQIG